MFIVVLILVAAIVSNVVANVRYPELLDTLPVIGLAVWAAILVAVPLRQPDWGVLPETFKGTIFLLVARHLRLDDAGREAARSPPGRRRWAWASSRPCSTTSRSPRSP